MKDMPKKPLEQMALVDSCGVEDGEKGKLGAIQANGQADTKENLRQFIDSVHQKASQVVQWLGMIDESANERSKKLPSSSLRMFA